MSTVASRAPLSSAQQHLFAEENLYRTRAAYTVASGVRMTGEFSVPALRAALAAVTDRHEALRTSIHVIDGKPAQVVLASVEPDLVHVDLADRPEAERAATAWELLAEAQDRPFDLTRAPLCRALLIRIAPDEHWLLLTLHHIVVDGWGMGVLWRDLRIAYESALTGETPSFAPLPLTYTQYAERQHHALGDGRLARSLDHWRHRLAGPLPGPALPLDRPRPPVRAFSGACHVFTLPGHLVRAVRELTVRNRTTSFVVLLSVFACLLQRYGGEDDVIVGVPLSGRHLPGTENLVGYLVNPLPLRLRPVDEMSVDELVAQTRRATLEAIDHQDLPFDRLVRAVAPHRDLSVQPLFQTMFSVQEIPENGAEFPGVHTTALPLPDGRTATSDLNVLFHDAGTTIEAYLEYRSDLFDAATIERLAGHLHHLLADAARPGATVGRLRTHGPDEERLLVRELPGTAPAARPALIHTLVERHADRTPDAIAVRDAAGARLTYAELDRRANQVARALRERGVGPDRLVGVRMPRGADLVVALLGVLKAGGAYLPLDPSYPERRLRQIVDDARPALVLDALPAHAHHPSERLPAVTGPDNLAYVMYTSGSTGRAKGVMITHASVVNFVAVDRPMSPRPDDVVVLHSSTAFDASAYELWSTLCAGAQLLVAPGDRRLGLDEYGRLLDEATALLLTPGLFAVLAEHHAAALRDVRHLNLGGDQLAPDAVARVRDRPGPTTLNCYGPTECTVAVAAGPATSRTPFGRVPIGGPLPGVRLHVLDRRLRPVPLGVPGELYVGGAALARGYAGRPALTALRFVASPFEPGARLYRTGDVVRRLADGSLEVLGRNDDQVKIRGFRIEPAEVEEALRTHPAVRSAVVVAGRDGRGLVGYVTTTPRAPDPGEEILGHLRERLPGYMVPGALVVLDELPLTVNGKVDRARLPEPSRAPAPPRPASGLTPAQRLVAEVWKEVLETEDIALDDDFFESGGDSLRALRIVAELTDRGVPVSLGDLYRLGTIRGCAELVPGSPGQEHA